MVYKVLGSVLFHSSDLIIFNSSPCSLCFSHTWLLANLGLVTLLFKGHAFHILSACRLFYPESCRALSFTSFRSTLVRIMLTSITEELYNFDGITKQKFLSHSCNSLIMVLLRGRWLSCRGRLGDPGSFSSWLCSLFWQSLSPLFLASGRGSRQWTGTHHFCSHSLERNQLHRHTEFMCQNFIHFYGWTIFLCMY